MTNRNAPCPCGSGRKYKHCHLTADEAGRTSWQGLRLAEGNLRAAPGASRTPPSRDVPGRWELVVNSVPISIGDDPSARPVVVLVAADRQVLHAQVLGNAPADVDKLAVVVASELRAAFDKIGAPPVSIAVRGAELARAISAALEAASRHDKPLGERRALPRVVDAKELPDADHAWRSFVQFFAPTANVDGAHVARPERWSGWALPTDVVARLHSAAAAFYRAAPWRWFADSDVIRMGTAAPWHASVMGNGGIEFGLALYANRDDLDAIFSAPDDRGAFLHPAGAVVSLTFDASDDVPAAMRKEVRAAGWEIAGTQAWPVLMIFGTPGGGVTAGQAIALATALECLARFADAYIVKDAPAPPPDEWRDPVVGVDFTVDVGDEPIGRGPWVVPTTLEPCGPQGPNAQPGAMLHLKDAARPSALLAALGPYLERLGQGRLSPTTALRRSSVAADFLGYLLFQVGVPLQAVTEHDLRCYLYMVVPGEEAGTERDAVATLSALRHFFSALRRTYGVHCPWAVAILADREAFLERWRARPLDGDDEDAIGAYLDTLMNDLLLRELALPMPTELGLADGDTLSDRAIEVTHVAHRQWMTWRDALIGAGVTEPELVYDALFGTLNEWLRTRHSLFGNKTPRAYAKSGPRRR